MSLVPTKRTLAVLIESPNADSPVVLAVRRPDDDSDLPGVWGLPAASFRSGESEKDVVRRIGRTKLGVELNPVEPIREGSTDRKHETLQMVLYRAVPMSQKAIDLPAPDSDTGTTLYSAFAWEDPDVLKPGAEQGSLCCRLCLEHYGLL